MSAITCTKYVPKRSVTHDFESTSLAPRIVGRRADVTPPINDHVRQFPAKKHVAQGTVTAVRPGDTERARVAYDNSGRASMGAKLFGTSSPPSSIAAGAKPPFSLPQTYESKHWGTMTKAEFPAGQAVEVPDRVLQKERHDIMVRSAVQLGEPDAPLRGTPHTKAAFRPYDASWYHREKSYPIGGLHAKCHSDLPEPAETLEPQYAAHHYEPMTRRQYQGHARAAGADKAGRNEEILKSHFSFAESFSSAKGPDGKPVAAAVTDYRTVSANPIPTTAPKIKNRPPSAPSSGKNIYAVETAAEARPRTLSASEVSAAKMKSSVPIMGADAGQKKLVSENAGWVQKDADYSKVLTRDMTAFAHSQPAYKPLRREPINASVMKTEDGTTITSSVNLGVGDPTSYVTATKSQFRGIYFGNVDSRPW
jgi:hypothetical protein